jgi:hypothetical protein
VKASGSSRPGTTPEPPRIGEHAVHPLAAIFPELPSSDQEALDRSIATVGQLVPIIRCAGAVLSGRARLRSCIKAGVEPRFSELAEDADAVEAVLAGNLERRQLTRSQRAVSAARVATLRRGRPVKGQNCPFTVDLAAKRFGVSPRLVKSAGAVLRRKAPALVDVVQRGLVSVSRAASLTAVEDETLQSVLKKIRAAGTAGKRAEVIREALEAAGLRPAAPGEVPGRRMKESVEVLAAHVRAAKEPAGALGALFNDLARQAGLRLREPLETLVEPRQGDDPPDEVVDVRPSLKVVEDRPAAPDLPSAAQGGTS